MAIVALTADLFFAAKIGAAATHLGVAVENVRDPRALLERTARATGVILDLDATEDGAGLVAALKQAAPGVPVVAFVSHVRTDAIAAARAAGADHVLARSALAERLGAILTELAAEKAVTPASAKPGAR